MAGEFGLDIALDLFPLLAGVLASVACGLLGNFLVLRRQSLMGDAISHSVLPGLVVAFLLTSSRGAGVMFAGAAVAGVLTVVLVELVKRLGRVEPGAAMGVVFSVLFAAGVVLIEVGARQTDLDADCVLHGQLETLWRPDAPTSIAEMLRWSTIVALPRQVVTLGIMAVLAGLFVVVLFKELRIASFDPALATSLGFHAGALHYALMIFVAGATVASFEAVGSILVIAMLVCPASTARLLTDRLVPQVWWSIVIAMTSAVAGYWLATVPEWFGLDSVNVAGSMTVMSGALLVVAAVISPRHGVLARAIRRRSLARRVAREDLLAALYRASESGLDRLGIDRLRTVLSGHSFAPALALATREGLVLLEGDAVRLSSLGEEAAADLIRRHRLWEHYLVDEAGVAPDHVHETAERLEHVPVRPVDGPDEDPHGKRIP